LIVGGELWQSIAAIFGFGVYGAIKEKRKKVKEEQKDLKEKADIIKKESDNRKEKADKLNEKDKARQEKADDLDEKLEKTDDMDTFSKISLNIEHLLTILKKLRDFNRH